MWMRLEGLYERDWEKELVLERNDLRKTTCVGDIVWEIMCLKERVWESGKKWKKVDL
jgi:hypothetical protein